VFHGEILPGRKDVPAAGQPQRSQPR
jgi:hypothetical protein